MARISCTQEAGKAATDAALVIETASENLQTKLSIIAEICAAAPDTAVIATNTSALSVTELAAVASYPTRVAGMHVFNPVHKMKPVEIIRALETSDATIARLRDWSDRIGKTSIIVNEAPGFTTSRISAMLGNEAMWMLSERCSMNSNGAICALGCRPCAAPGAWEQQSSSNAFDESSSGRSCHAQRKIGGIRHPQELAAVWR